MCFEASLPGLRKQRGGWGGRSPPPFANTTLASLVWKGYSYAGLKNSGGFKGAQTPPHLQTQCSHHGFGRDSYALNKLARRQTNNKYVLCIMNLYIQIALNIYIYAFLLRFLIFLSYKGILYDIVFYDTLFHYIVSLYFVLIYTHTYIICYVMFSYRTKYTIMTKSNK